MLCKLAEPERDLLGWAHYSYAALTERPRLQIRPAGVSRIHLAMIGLEVLIGLGALTECALMHFPQRQMAVVPP